MSERDAKWDRRWMGLAAHIALWSKDPSTKVGAVIVNTHTQRIVSTGFNGFPPAAEDRPSVLYDRAAKYARTVHAEQNSLLYAAPVTAAGASLYVTPLPPCTGCAKLIAAAGIRRVVYRANPNPLTAEKWSAEFEESRALLEECGVVVEELKYED